MPVLTVSPHRCKTCLDVGFVIQRVVNDKHPHVERHATLEDPRTGLELNAGLPVAPGRWHEVEVPCFDCPPVMAPVRVRDWERP